MTQLPRDLDELATALDTTAEGLAQELGQSVEELRAQLKGNPRRATELEREVLSMRELREFFASRRGSPPEHTVARAAAKARALLNDPPPAGEAFAETPDGAPKPGIDLALHEKMPWGVRRRPPGAHWSKYQRRRRARYGVATTPFYCQPGDTTMAEVLTWLRVRKDSTDLGEWYLVNKLREAAALNGTVTAPRLRTVLGAISLAYVLWHCQRATVRMGFRGVVCRLPRGALSLLLPQRHGALPVTTRTITKYLAQLRAMLGRGGFLCVHQPNPQEALEHELPIATQRDERGRYDAQAMNLYWWRNNAWLENSGLVPPERLAGHLVDRKSTYATSPLYPGTSASSPTGGKESSPGPAPTHPEPRWGSSVSPVAVPQAGPADADTGGSEGEGHKEGGPAVAAEGGGAAPASATHQEGRGASEAALGGVDPPPPPADAEAVEARRVLHALLEQLERPAVVEQARRRRALERGPP